MTPQPLLPCKCGEFVIVAPALTPRATIRFGKQTLHYESFICDALPQVGLGLVLAGRHRWR